MKYRENPSEPWKEYYIKALDSMEIGSVIDFAGKREKIPVGWLICDGSAISRTEYSELFDAIGTNWGTGDGSTTFNLPPAGIVRVGYDANDTDFNAIGKTGGSKELQSHEHIIPLGNGGSIGAEGTNDRSARMKNCTLVDTTAFKTGSTGTGNSGNLQPYGTFYTLIKAKNTTPTMASVVNTTNSSTTDAYSCDYVNNLVDYSTTEMNTGKRWIDGKPIYRKVVEGTLSTGTGQKIIQHNITNLDNLISCIGSIKIGTTNEWYLLPFSAAIDAVSTYGISIQYINGSHIAYFVGSGMGTNVKYTKAIIEYTKTTD